MVRYCKLFLNFYGDDLAGVTNLTEKRWYHTAFVFDTVGCNQSLYLDGVLDSSQQANSVYLGMNGSLNIGVNHWSSYDTNFDGLIDQLSYTNRTKTSDEILRDATLTLSFSFDGNPIIDEGPLHINGSLAGSTSFVPGRRGQALLIDNASNSYFTAQGLVLLGRVNQAYSLSIWIRPASQQRATLIRMSSLSNGTGWCVPMIGLTNTSQLTTTSWSGAAVTVFGPLVPANSWTHAAVTYSSANGLRLYANGSLSSVSSPFSFQASGTPNYLFVGSPRSAISFPWWCDSNGQYSGAVDELQVYSRELSSGDITALVCP